MKYIIFLIFLYASKLGIAQAYLSGFKVANDLTHGNGYSSYINQGGQLNVGAEPTMSSYLLMFETTGDKRYMEQFVIQAKRIQNRRDDDVNYCKPPLAAVNEIPNGSQCSLLVAVPDIPDSRGWSTDIDIHGCDVHAEWVQRVLHTGQIIYPMAKFVYMMKTNPKAMELLQQLLPEEIRNSARPGSDCVQTLNTYEDFMNWLNCRVNQSIIYHDANWCSDIGLYKRKRQNDPCDETEENGVDAPNMQCGMGRALIMMYLAENRPGGDASLAAQYLNKISNIAGFTKQKMLDNPQSGFYTWGHEADNTSLVEDIGHANVVMSFAELCYKYGITGYFTLSDMQKLGNTVANKIYAAPLRAHLNTYGTNNDNQYELHNPQDHFYEIGSYAFMSPYNPYIYQIVSDYYSPYALKTEELIVPHNTVGHTAFSNLAYYQGILNPIAVKRDNQVFKAWLGLCSGDFNNDGSKEFIATSFSGGLVQIYQQSSMNGGITLLASHSGYDGLRKLCAADVIPSNPGDELIGINETSNVLVVYGVNSSWGLTQLSSIPLNLGSPVVGVSYGELYQNSPEKEIIVCDVNGNFNVYRYNYFGNTLIQVHGGSTNPDTKGITTGDFRPDIIGDEIAFLYQQAGQGKIKILSLNDVQNSNALSSNSLWTKITSGDFDADGISEITVHDDVEGRLQILKVKNGVLMKVGEEYFKPDQGITQIGSMKADGATENLITLRYFDGQINMFSMSGICTGFELSNQTINEASSLDHSYTGVQSHYKLDYHANNILTATNVIIEGDGTKVDFTAGKEVALLAGFSSKQGGELNGFIDPSLYCGTEVFRQAPKQQHKEPVVNYVSIPKKTEREIVKPQQIISVYPNPSTNGSYVDLKDDVNYSYTVSDLLGRTILAGKLPQSINYIDMSTFEKGIYIITMAKENKTETRKIILE